MVDTQNELDQTNIKLGSTELELAKQTDRYNTAVKDLADTNEKLLKTQRHSHDIERQLGMEIEKNQKMAIDLHYNMTEVSRKMTDIEEYEKRFADLLKKAEENDTKR